MGSNRFCNFVLKLKCVLNDNTWRLLQQFADNWTLLIICWSCVGMRDNLVLWLSLCCIHFIAKLSCCVAAGNTARLCSALFCSTQGSSFAWVSIFYWNALRKYISNKTTREGIIDGCRLSHSIRWLFSSLWLAERPPQQRPPSSLFFFKVWPSS